MAPTRSPRRGGLSSRWLWMMIAFLAVGLMGAAGVAPAVQDAAAALRGDSAYGAAPSVEAGEAGTPDAGLPREEVPPESVPQPVP